MPCSNSLKNQITFMLILGKIKLFCFIYRAEREETGVRLALDLGLWGPCTFCTQSSKKQNEISPESIYNSF